MTSMLEIDCTASKRHSARLPPNSAKRYRSMQTVTWILCNVKVGIRKHGIHAQLHISLWKVPETPWIQKDPRMIPIICGTIGEKAYVILVWLRALDIGNTSHPHKLGIMEVRPCVMNSLLRLDFRMLKNTSTRGLS